MIRRHRPTAVCAVQVITQVIYDAVRMKAEVVTLDERESGVRSTLNFGHTIGHAIEVSSLHRRRYVCIDAYHKQRPTVNGHRGHSPPPPPPSPEACLRCITTACLVV
jgi:hypothetical protein